MRTPKPTKFNPKSDYINLAKKFILSRVDARQPRTDTGVIKGGQPSPRTLTRSSISLNLAFRLFDPFDNIPPCSDEVSVWSEVF